MDQVSDTFRGLSRVIGNTPLLGIEFRFRGCRRVVYAKCEHLNLTGSIKDRMAVGILRWAYSHGQIQPGDTIVEATSGNTGISFAAVAPLLGHPVVIFMPDWMSAERKALIESYGASVVSVSKEQGGFRGAISMAEQRAQQPHTFLPRQFSNEANVWAHASTTGPEIVTQLRAAGLPIHAFVAGVGTGGTVMGVARHLRAQQIAAMVRPVEPAESPTLSRGCKVGSHRIQGISDEFIPAIVQLSELGPPLAVSDGDAILMAQKLAKELGLAVGISSGGNFLAAVQAQEELDGKATVATVFPDDNKKYLTTDLLRDEPVRESFLSPHIELLNVRFLPRVCDLCAGGSNGSTLAAA